MEERFHGCFYKANPLSNIADLRLSFPRSLSLTWLENRNPGETSHFPLYLSLGKKRKQIVIWKWIVWDTSEIMTQCINFFFQTGLDLWLIFTISFSTRIEEQLLDSGSMLASPGITMEGNLRYDCLEIKFETKNLSSRTYVRDLLRYQYFDKSPSSAEMTCHSWKDYHLSRINN